MDSQTNPTSTRQSEPDFQAADATQTDTRVAYLKARSQFLQQQALTYMQAARMLKTQLMMADEAQELTVELKQWLYKELVMCASIVEVKSE